MTKIAYVLLAGLISGDVAAAQDLPPEILLLSRVKRHVQEELQRLYSISCLETVHREYQPVKGKMRPLDTVRLEVLSTGDKEFYASPGGRKFSERHPITYAGSGMLGNGIFALYLRDILLSDIVLHKYRGEEQVGGRSLGRYDYRLSQVWGKQVIKLPEGTGQVGLHGSFWVDPQTYDVLRLELHADDIPASLPLIEFVTRIDYARSDLGNHLTALLPQSAESRMVKVSGESSRNRIEFSDCRVFGAQSTVDFDAPDTEQPPRFGVAAIDDTLRSLPRGLRITVLSRSRISSDMAVGTLIDGAVADNVRSKGVVIAAGSPVRGSIRRLERFIDPVPHFVVGLEYTEVELQGIRYRLAADVIEMDATANVQQTLVTRDEAEAWNLLDGGMAHKQTRETISFVNQPGVATFFSKGGKLDLPPGFRTVWKTR